LPAAAPSAHGLFGHLKNWAVREAKSELFMRPQSPLRGLSEGALTGIKWLGVSGVAGGGIYAALAPLQVGLARIASHYVDPASKQFMALHGLVQNGGIPQADLTKLYEGWSGRRNFEAAWGMKHEPDQAAPGQRKDASLVVNLEAVKAATGDENFQRYILGQPQYQEKVAQEMTALENGGAAAELNVLTKASIAHEIPTKDAGAKSQEYQVHLYNGKVPPLAVLAVETLGGVAMNLIPGVSEVTLARTEVKELRDPTLTRTEKTFQTVRNLAASAALVCSFVIPNPIIGVASWAAEQATDLVRNLWNAHEQKKCATESCDGEPAAPAPANA